jgi:hypothetical protein
MSNPFPRRQILAAAVAGFMMLGLLILITAAARAAANAGGERIGIRNGRFVNLATGTTFVPVGCNVLRLATLADGKKEHATFCPGVYDSAETERMMRDLETHGLNTVRAFQVYAVGPGGIMESKDDREISPGYVANVVDFLRAARRHGIHVIFTWDMWLPESARWAADPVTGETEYRFQPKWVTAMNSNNFMLTLPSVRTRSNAVLALIRAIRQTDASLLPVVLAWEIENEIHFDVDKEPLKSRPAAFQFAGRTYNLGSSKGAQDFMDDAFVQWCDFSADAIHAADPEALVSVSVFPFGAVGRPGPWHSLEDTTKDPRVPARPLALLRSKLDFIDLHIYAFTDGSPNGFERNCEMQMASDECPELQKAALQAGKPILIGETGVNTHLLKGASSRDGVQYPFDYRLGLSVLQKHLSQLKGAAFTGALVWYYGDNPATPNQEYPLLETFPEYQDMLRNIYQK